MTRKVAIEKMRIGGSKVRTGCRTCKSRRVKCDEAKPACQRCTKAGRTCEGYSPAPKPVTFPAGHKFVHYVDPDAGSVSDRSSPNSTLTPSRTPSPYPDRELASLRSLNFYQHSTALRLGEPFGGDLFSNVLPRLMYNNLAIQHSVIALAAFHENFTNSGHNISYEQRRILALDHYNKSVQAVVHLNIDNPTDAVLTTLVTCLLYCAIESVQGHLNSGLRHVASGIKLLAAHQDELLLNELLGHGVSHGFLNTLRQLFMSLHFQCSSIDEGYIDQGVVALVQHQTTSKCEEAFITIASLEADLTELQNELLWFGTATEKCHEQQQSLSEELTEHGERFALQYENWCAAYARLLGQSQRSGTSFTLSQRAACLVLNINRLSVSIMLKVFIVPGQTIFDRCRPEFEAIVDLSQEFMEIERTQQQQREGLRNPGQYFSPSFGLSMGIIPSLYFTCSRCRHNETRRKALDILRTCQRRESIWDSTPVSLVAEKQIEMEEKSVRQYWSSRGVPEIDLDDPAYFPEEIRIDRVKVDFDGMDEHTKISIFEKMNDLEETDVLFWDPDAQKSHRSSPVGS